MLRVLGGCVLLVGLLVLLREGIAAFIRYKHRIRHEKGIEEIASVRIGGIQQVISIRGTNVENPMMLFLHGGPGFTEMPVSYVYQDEWEQDFTVVQWDQRLAGKTYMKNPGKYFENDGMAQRVDDVIEMAEYLRSRFDKAKITLVGHSWGTALGISTIKRRPDLFSVYVGIEQLVNLKKGEAIGFRKTLDLATAMKAKKDIEKLNELLPYPDRGGNQYYPDFPRDMLSLREFQRKYGIGMPVSYIENAQSFGFSPYYSLKDIYYFFTDITRTNEAVQRELYEEYDLVSLGLNFSVPVFFIFGEHDWTTPVSLLEEIFPAIQAPHKELHIVKGAAHRPMVDNPKEFLAILREKVYPYAKD